MKKMFCPFRNDSCIEACVFYTKGQVLLDDNSTTHCLIAKGLNNISDRQEDYFDIIIREIKSIKKSKFLND